MISDLFSSLRPIVPPAALTSGRALTFVSSDSGTVALPLVEPLTISLPPMTASVWAYDESKIPSNAFCIVSVRM